MDLCIAMGHCCWHVAASVLHIAFGKKRNIDLCTGWWFQPDLLVGTIIPNIGGKNVTNHQPHVSVALLIKLGIEHVLCNSFAVPQK